MSDETPRQPEGGNPFEEILRQLGLSGAEGDMGEAFAQLQQRMGQFMTQFQQMFSGEEGVDWSQAKNAARHVTAAAGADPTPSPATQQRVREALELADMWVGEATTLPGVEVPGVAMARADWVEATMDTWPALVDPIVTRIADELQGLASGRDEIPDDFAQQMQPMLRRAAGAMFAAQVGQEVGQLATQVVSASDAGLPLTRRPTLALLPTNIAQFSEGLGQPERDVWMFLAAREAARSRLFTHVGWLPGQILVLIEHYAREITIDADALASSVEGFQGASLEEWTAIADQQQSLFRPQTTPEQRDVLQQLETLLALIEGWVDLVATAAVSPWLADASALAESVRRRRAAGGPAEKTLATLVGIDLAPRRVRDATRLWQAIEHQRGRAGRDDVWHHPDLMPVAADLDDPMGYATGDGAAQRRDALDDEIADLLGGEPS